MDVLEKEFDSFCEARGWARHENELSLLKRVKVFFGREKKYSIPLHGRPAKDCLTLSAAAVSLLWRKGFHGNVARPKQFSRFLHGFVVYPKGRELKSFIIAGRVRRYSPVVLSPTSVARRLRFTRPILSLFDRCATEERI